MINNSKNTNLKDIIIFLFGFLLNVPLIFMYPLMLFTGSPLGYINFFLHSWLFVSWGT
jgi:hypothetical protein